MVLLPGRLTLTLWVTLLPVAQAFPSNRNNIPNGFRVPCPDAVTQGCENGICNAVGHASCKGATLPLNPFGEDMAAAGHKWTQELCEKDSDDDGLTNGEELGDPCCLFAKFDLPSAYTQTFNPSHPGYKTSTVENYVRPASCELTKPNGKSPELGKFNEGEVRKSVDLLIANYTIPMPGNVAPRTHYVDIAWNFPDDSAELFHAVFAEGIVNLPKNLHHYVVQTCRHRWPDHLHGKRVTKKQRKKASCNEFLEFFGAWAPGSNILETPSWAGKPLGKATGIQSFLVNFHFDNPDLENGLVSTDGMRIHYTPTLRKQNYDFFSIMQISANPLMFVPPLKSRYFITRRCSMTVTDNNGRHVDAHLLTWFYHAHLLGREMYAERIRGEERLAINANDKWHFDDQGPENLYLKNITVRTGDILQSTCIFNSMGHANKTRVGPETTDEMCWGMFTLVEGGLDVKCSGNVWAGDLGSDSALGIDLTHPQDSADGVWDGTDLLSGGQLVRSNPEAMIECQDFREVRSFCPVIAMMVTANPSKCNSTIAELPGMPRTLNLGSASISVGHFKPLAFCCTALCESVCPMDDICLMKKKVSEAAVTDVDSSDSDQDASSATVGTRVCTLVIMLTLLPQLFS